MTVLKAHGITPTWSPKLNHKGLSEESQEAFRKIDLRWHDLRHEYASRLVEQGVPLAQVRDLLGHASITTTERYDNQKLANLQIAATKLERGRMFAAVEKVRPTRGIAVAQRPTRRTADNAAGHLVGQNFKILSRSG